jgi:hypothetical protein
MKQADLSLVDADMVTTRETGCFSVASPVHNTNCTLLGILALKFAAHCRLVDN